MDLGVFVGFYEILGLFEGIWGILRGFWGGFWGF